MSEDTQKLFDESPEDIQKIIVEVLALEKNKLDKVNPRINSDVVDIVKNIVNKVDNEEENEVEHEDWKHIYEKF